MCEKNFQINELIEQKLMREIFNIENVDIKEIRSILNRPINVILFAFILNFILIEQIIKDINRFIQVEKRYF